MKPLFPERFVADVAAARAALATSVTLAALLLAIMAAVVLPLPTLAADGAAAVTIMPVGDSITEGGGSFRVYRYPLMEKLLADGYNVRYVGTQKTGAQKDSPLGVLPHEGRDGNSVQAVLKNFEAGYRQFPADIVLIHTGHNQDSANAPVPGMIKSTRAIIEKVREINPKVIVLVAQVITSGKLPKYDYIPEYNSEVAKLAAELNTKEQPVIAVDMATGWDWQTDCVGDKVHPAKSGGEKMAQKWFDALVKVLPPPAAPPTAVTK